MGCDWLLYRRRGQRGSSGGGSPGVRGKGAADLFAEATLQPLDLVLSR